MYILMGGNPNYRDTATFIYNRSTGLLDDGVVICEKCSEILTSNSTICKNCKEVIVK